MPVVISGAMGAGSCTIPVEISDGAAGGGAAVIPLETSDAPGARLVCKAVGAPTPTPPLTSDAIGAGGAVMPLLTSEGATARRGGARAAALVAEVDARLGRSGACGRQAGDDGQDRDPLAHPVRLDVGVEQPLQLPFLEGEGDLVPAGLGQQALEVLDLPAEGKPSGLPSLAVGRDALDVEQEIDRLIGPERLLHVVPGDRRHEAPFRDPDGLDEAMDSASLVHAPSLLVRRRRRNDAHRQDGLPRFDLPPAGDIATTFRADPGRKSGQTAEST
jgi:hypothetical protein